MTIVPIVARGGEGLPSAGVPRSRGSKDKTLKLYDGYFHDPLNDVGKERVTADVTEWLRTRAR